MGTPLQSLFGTNTGAGTPNQIEGGPAGRADLGGPRYQRGNGPPPNNNVHSRIEAATAAARRCNPEVNYQKVMATAPQPRPRITTMQLHRSRCFNYLFFGKCKDPRCSFQHDGEVDEAKVDGAIAKMSPGLAKFVELN